VHDPDFAPQSIENAFPALDQLARMTEDEFRAIYSGTAVTRAKHAGLSRNAAIALGNSQDERAAPILSWMLQEHDVALARGHAAWGLRHLLGDDARRGLSVALARERDPYVISEIEDSLAA
jgi:epoxyqueuosine reductase